ncbi:hypothetical protein ACMFMG_011169 [Clarireedia jacksonii]
MFTPKPIFVLPFLLFPTPHVFASPTSTTTPYQVTSYRSSCSPAGCIYKFSISLDPLSDSSSNEPAFDTTCRGTNMQDVMKACADETISADQSSGVNEVMLLVMHKYTVDGVEHARKGGYTIAQDGSDSTAFEISPTDV